jgi:predicted dehydrogenase
VRFGYVGCGFMAQGVHIPNFAAIPGVELVALAELRPELGAKVQRRWGFRKLYRSHLDLASDPEVEAVGVSAAFGEQPAIAQDLLRAGKHVFMEKPMATSVAQAEAMLEAGRAGGGRLMVAYMKRYDGGNEIAKGHLDQFRKSGELGPAFYARNHGFCGNWTAGFDAVMETSDEPRPAPAPARYPDWLPEPLRQPYIGYLQQYTHNINLLRWFLDAGDQARVTAVDLDQDGYTGLVTFDMKGVRAVVESGSVSHHAWEEHTQVYFRDGWVRVASPPLLMKNASATVEIYRGARGKEPGSFPTYQHPVAIPHSWAFKREAEHFIACVRSGEPFRSSGEDTVTDVRLFEEIYRMHMASRA